MPRFIYGFNDITLENKGKKIIIVIIIYLKSFKKERVLIHKFVK